MPVDSGRDYGVSVNIDTENIPKDNIIVELKKIIGPKRDEYEKKIKAVSTENPPEDLVFYTDKARQYMLERFNELGVPIPDSQIIDPLFVDDKYQSYFVKEFDKTPGANGFYSILNKRPVVFYGGKNPLNNTHNYADRVYHEMFHTTGSNILTFDGSTVDQGRVGFITCGSRSQYKPWLLEEGLAVYESANFCEKLSSEIPPQFSEEYKIKQDRINKKSLKNGKLQIFLNNNQTIEINPKYSLLSVKPDSKNAQVIVTTQSLAGGFIDDMLNSIPETEKKEFLKTIFVARNDPTQIPKLANTIDNYFGKETYTKILKCEENVESVLALTKQLESTKSSKQ